MRSNLQIVKDSYAAAARGEFAKVLKDVAPDCAWTEMAGSPYAGTYIGPEQIAQNVFQRIASEWDDFACIPDAYFDAGDTIIVTSHYSGIHKTTRKLMHSRTAHIWQLQQGKIVRFEQMTNTLALFRAAQPSAPDNR
jgi:uncharacterized protein